MNTSRQRPVSLTWDDTNKCYTFVTASDKGRYLYAEPTFEYSQFIDLYDVFSPLRGDTGAVRTQPQLHIGMSPIPQLNPANDSTSFLNASMYYQVDCSINLSYSLESQWVDGGVSVLSHNAMFSSYSKKMYGHPVESLGCAQVSNLFSSSNLERMERLADDARAEAIARRVRSLRLQSSTDRALLEEIDNAMVEEEE
ncbi:hypothetical protein M8J76_015857 [Diaphorina citri]|nr:hypothetical protein M8J75_011473 [Diaphorina citri]KAI5714358.1 hypothetical protein M8J76_015857 [Diaphorina citri]